MRPSPLATLLLSLSLAGCDLEKTGNQLLAEKAMVGTLLATPPVTLYVGDMVGGPDAGSPDAGSVTVPGSTVAFVFFGERQGSNPGTPPSPIPDAAVRLQLPDGGVVALEPRGEGVYTRESGGEDAELRYAPHATYDFVAEVDGERFVGRVQDAPALESIPELHPAQGYVQLAAGQELLLTRAAVPAGAERTLGFVTVFPVSAEGQKGQPTYSNVPTTPLDFLLAVANPAELRTAQVLVPGTAFPAAGSTYLVSFQSVRMGGAESDNLFVGSALLAGTSDVGVVRTQ